MIESLRRFPKLFTSWFVDYSFYITALGIIASQLISNYYPDYGLFATILWKAAGVAMGAWVGQIIYTKYFCSDTCQLNDVHRMYFILGCCAVFAIR